VVECTEMHGWYLTQLAFFRGCERESGECLQRVLGGDAKPVGGRAAYGELGTVFNIAPCQYWVVTHNAAVDRAWPTVVAPLTGSVTPLSHSRVRLAVSGPAVRAMLGKLVSVDLAPKRLRVGDFVQTALHHTGILLHRADEQRYELYLPRSFAASLWSWLNDAALSMGELSMEQNRT